MALRLRIVSEHATRLGDKATKVFGVHGGSIGRARDNDWTLPDPERYLSGKHARVDFRAGTYFLVDTSSNGTYVNGAQVPLGKFHDYAMQDGDYLRLGQYELLVSIDTSNDFPPDDGAIVAYDGGSPSAAVKKSTADDIGADLDLSELLEPSGALDEESGIVARNAYGQAVSPPDGEAGTPWHMMTRPLVVNRSADGSVDRDALRDLERAAAERVLERSGFGERSNSGERSNFFGERSNVGERSAGGERGSGSAGAGPAGADRAAAAARQQAPQLFDADIDPGLAALCRGAGIDPRSLPAEARGAALQLAGQLLRESVLGLMDLNQSRVELRNRFRMGPPADEEAGPGVSFVRGGVQDILLRLLSTLSARAGSVESMRDNFRELKAQNTATLAAMQSALDQMLARFDPKELEERFDRGTKRGVFGAPGKGKYWEFYAELYAGLSQRPADGFPHLFLESFAKDFEAKMRALMPPKRGSFGGDGSDGAGDP